MPLRYAASTVMTPEYTLQEAAALLKGLGYDGIEWRVHSVPSSTPTKADFWRGNKATVDIETIAKKAGDVRKIAEDADLEIVSLATYLSYKLLDDVERCLNAAKVMGCRSIRVSSPAYDGSENYNDLYEEAIGGYAAIEDLARQYGVRANIELRSGNICPSASLAYRLVSNFDPDCIGVILDPGNMMMEGYEGWQMGLELLGPYLSHVHAKNMAWVQDCASPEGIRRWKPTVVPMKEGLVPWGHVMLALDKVGYKGWLSVEDFAPGDTKAKLAADLAYLKGLESALDI